MTKYWQIASGAGDRYYHEEFINWGIAFVGERYWDSKSGKGMKHVEKGDRILLRGRRKDAEEKDAEEIVAVGEVVEYEGSHNGCKDREVLKDFDGWDLPAYCFVDWYRVSDRKKTSIRRTIAQIGEHNDLRRYADSVLQERGENRVGDPKNVPREPAPIDLEEIVGTLAGPDLVENLTLKLRRIRSLARHYYDFGYKHWDEVKEHEIRTFLIVPLLLALGWDEERIKIELSPGRLGVDDGQKSIDIACFSRQYEKDSPDANRENCHLIIESKRFSSGITIDAPAQAKKYAKELNCKTIVVSNGYCYKGFVREDGEFRDTPHAYLNLLKPTRNYPLEPKIGGALQMLELLKA